MGWTRILQVQVSATTTVVAADTQPLHQHTVRVRGYTIVAFGTGGGDVKFQDATASAVTRITEAVPAVAGSWINVHMPDSGVLFKNGLVVVVPTSVKVGVQYDG